MRGNFGRWGAACLAVGLALAAPATAADYGHYLIGDTALPTPGPVQRWVFSHHQILFLNHEQAI